MRISRGPRRSSGRSRGKQRGRMYIYTDKNREVRCQCGSSSFWNSRDLSNKDEDRHAQPVCTRCGNIPHRSPDDKWTYENVPRKPEKTHRWVENDDGTGKVWKPFVPVQTPHVQRRPPPMQRIPVKTSPVQRTRTGKGYARDREMMRD